MPLQSGEIVDRYRVEGLLGRGALAEVYRVRHLELGLQRALKLITRNSPGVMQRAIQEGRIQSMLKHENIVSVVDVFRVGGSPALVMELVDGPSLESLLRHYHPSLMQADALARALMQALAHAHGAGLIHRDLKPANILVSVQGRAAQPRISDFGLARVCVTSDELPAGPRMTSHGVMMGTPAYMAPEQFSDASSVDARADLFALGATLYEMLTGVMAFPQVDAMGCYRAIAANAWRPVRELVPSAPDRMVRAIERALRPEHGERIATAEQLLDVWTGRSEGRFVALPDDLSEIWETSHLALIRALAPPLFERSAETCDASEALITPTPEHGGSRIDPPEVLPPPLPPPPPPTSPPPSLTWRTAPPSRSEVEVAPSVHELRGAPRPRTLVLTGLLAVLLGALSLWMLRDATPSDPAPSPPTSAREAPREVPSAAAAEVEAPLAAELDAPATPSPTSAPSASQARAPSAAQPRPEATPPAAPPPAPTPARATAEPSGDNVTVSGVSQAWLIDASGARHRPGRIAPGSYTLSVFFEPGTPTSVLTLDVVAGRTYTIRCEAGLKLCR